MGAPPSAVLAEIYLQFLEHSNIYNTLNKIIGYFRYLDDILLIFNEKLGHTRKPYATRI
jgi:hypothetical protein